MKTILSILFLSIACGFGQTSFRAMTNLPALVTTLGTSNTTSIGTFKSDSELALWLTCYGTNANCTGNLALVFYVSPDGTNYGTEPIRFNWTMAGTATNTFRTNFPIELSRMARNFKLTQLTNASASSAVISGLVYSRKL